MDSNGRDEETVASMVEGAVRRIATSLGIAGALIALAIYVRPGPPSFQAFATDTGFVRIDTRSGTVIGCETGRCMTLLRRGQDLAPNPNREPDAVAPAAQPKALPAPDQRASPTAPPAAPARAPARGPGEPEPAPTR